MHSVGVVTAGCAPHSWTSVCVAPPSTALLKAWNADQPLSGSVLWPGAVPGPNGRGIDWPGWRQLSDGTWVQGDEFDWVRPTVQVLFQVNPEATVTVSYPPSSPNCLTNPPTSEVLGEPPLSATGSNVGPLLGTAAALAIIGTAVLGTLAWLRRREADGS